MMRLPVSPAFEKNNLAITLQTSDYFAPYASVTILSIIENASSEYNYDFLVMTWDMQEKTEEKLISMADGKNNISIRVVDVSREIKCYTKAAKRGERFQRFSFVGVVRLLLPDLLASYDIILNLDCDMLVCADISELFEYDLSNYYMGGTPEVLGYVLFSCPKQTYLTDEIIYNNLQLNSVQEYVNGGLLLLNLKNIRKDFTKEEIIDFAIVDGVFRKYFEQDVFNCLFRKKKLKLSPVWNWFVDSTKQIAQGSKYLSQSDIFLQRYYDAESDVKILHFFTDVKPWINGKCPYAKEWWCMAQHSPFLNSLLISQTTSGSGPNEIFSMPHKGNKNLLFICDSLFQIINVLNIKFHYYYNVPADLILCSSTGLINYKEKIELTKLFRKVYISKYTATVDFLEIFKIPINERTLHPEKYKNAVPLYGGYTDLFVPVLEYHYYQMIYYHLIKLGDTPYIHIFDDGGETYVENFNTSKMKSINHQLYGATQRFPNNVTDMYMYRPDCYCGASNIRILPIPGISSEDTSFCEILHSIFGKFDVPTERYIFFNECFAETHKVSNEMQILDEISEIVGKDNIAVKLHPRSAQIEALYQLHGYHVIPSKEVPWEMAVLSSSINNKVLLSISSNTIWTPQFIARKSIKAISLINIMKLSRRPHAEGREYWTFLRKTQTFANTSETTFYIPNTLLELKQIIQYIEGES